VSLGVAVVLGATSMSDIALLTHQDLVLINRPSESTVRRALEGAAATFKKGHGFHPLGAWCSNTAEGLAMLLRPGNSGSNTVADHVRVLGDTIAQLPVAYRRKILIRVDEACATHELLKHIEAMNRLWRSVKSHRCRPTRGPTACSAFTVAAFA
jgi:Transposase DDE domain group 1